MVKLRVHNSCPFVAAYLFGVCCTFGVARAVAPGQLLFKLTAPEPQSFAQFGDTLAVVDGDILVGEPHRWVEEVPLVGQVYLFDGQTGQRKRTVIHPEPGRSDKFGSALTGGDGLAIISANERVFVFDTGTGSLMRRIDRPEPRAQSFGDALAYLDGNVVISAPGYSVPFQFQSVGQGYLFDVVTGALQKTLPNPEPNVNDTLGVSVALTDDAAIMGSVADNSFAGRVWVFNRDTGAVKFTIDNPNPESPTFDWFGSPIAANEDIIVVTAQEDGTSGAEDSGTVYVFHAETGALMHTLFSPQNEPFGEFGRSVALTPRGDIVVGAFGTSTAGLEYAGRAYLFDGKTGDLLLDIPNPEPSESASFGWSVAATDNRIIVGALNALVDGVPTGAVYVFAVVPEPDMLGIAGALLCTGALVSSARRQRKTVKP